MEYYIRKAPFGIILRRGNRNPGASLQASGRIASSEGAAGFCLGVRSP